jgi:hypothetical protein
MTPRTWTLPAGLLAVGVATATVARAQDTTDIFGDMLDQKVLGLSEEATKDLADMLAKPGITNNTEAENKGEVNVLMGLGDKHCLTEAVLVRTAMVGKEQAEKDIAKWKKLLNSGEMSEMSYWQHITECKDYCAQVMVDAMACYQEEASKRFRGIFLFDTGVGSYQQVTQGDRASGGRTHNNERVMAQVVATLKANPGDHILLEGRASRVGNDEVNFRLSGTRSEAIKDELVKRGVPLNRVHYRWVGVGEPHYRTGMAKQYQIFDKFESFGEQTLNQSVTVYIYQPKGS